MSCYYTPTSASVEAIIFSLTILYFTVLPDAKNTPILLRTYYCL
jgi:hypothetical protein